MLRSGVNYYRLLLLHVDVMYACCIGNIGRGKSFKGFTVVSRKVTFPERRFPEKTFPGKSFPGKSLSRKVVSRKRRFPERRFPESHFPGKTFPGMVIRTSLSDRCFWSHSLGRIQDFRTGFVSSRIMAIARSASYMEV